MSSVEMDRYQIQKLNQRYAGMNIIVRTEARAYKGAYLAPGDKGFICGVQVMGGRVLASVTDGRTSHKFAVYSLSDLAPATRDPA